MTNKRYDLLLLDLWTFQLLGLSERVGGRAKWGQKGQKLQSLETLKERNAKAASRDQLSIATEDPFLDQQPVSKRK